jgi:branched-subunit amino acid aminotransferase/4-amino-4-deoxychorismate lyase
MDAVLRRNGLQAADSSLRLTLTRGNDPLGSLLPPETPPSPTLFLVAKSLDVGISEHQQLGISAIALRWGSPFNPLGIKSLNYLYNMLALAQARRDGAQEALFVATDGSVVEGTTSNLFSVTKGILTTPPVASGLLPGITREVVIELARKEGLAVREASLPLDDLLSADEAFVTGSLKEVMPLTAVDGRKIGAGSPGPATRLLQQRYREAVEEECLRGVRRARSNVRGAR